jgi:hypothetical protein
MFNELAGDWHGTPTSMHGPFGGVSNQHTPVRTVGRSRGARTAVPSIASASSKSPSVDSCRGRRGAGNCRRGRKHAYNISRNPRGCEGCDRRASSIMASTALVVGADSTRDASSSSLRKQRCLNKNGEDRPRLLAFEASFAFMQSSAVPSTQLAASAAWMPSYRPEVRPTQSHTSCTLHSPTVCAAGRMATSSSRRALRALPWAINPLSFVSCVALYLHVAKKTPAGCDRAVLE